MRYILSNCRNKLDRLGIDPTHEVGMRKLVQAMNNRLPGWLSWGYDVQRDELTIELPDPQGPDFSAFGDNPRKENR